MCSLGLVPTRSRTKTHARCWNTEKRDGYAVGLLLRDGPDDVQQPERAILHLKEAENRFLGHALAPLELGNMFLEIFSGDHVR